MGIALIESSTIGEWLAGALIFGQQATIEFDMRGLHVTHTGGGIFLIFTSFNAFRKQHVYLECRC